jgi:EmrB/QacA subfamily drug resistance transporter
VGESVGGSASRRLDRRWPILAVLCVSLLLVSLDNTILNVALPSIVRSLHASSAELQWIVDAYAIVFAGLLLVCGSLGDRLGRKWVYLAGLAIFAAGSTLSAFSGDSSRLTAARAFMGLGAAAIMPCTLSILTNVYTEARERARAIGIWSATTGLGVAIGPVVGGWLLSHFWWGSVFLVNVPIAIIGIAATAWIVPNSRNPQSAPPDPVGGGLSIAGMALLLWGIIEAPTRSWTSGLVIGSLVGAVLTLTAFVWWEGHTPHPMLPLSLFRSRRFSVAMGAMGLVIFALMGGLFVLTQHLQFLLGYSPLQAGLRVAPIAGALFVAAPFSTMIVRVIGTKPVVFIGLSLIAVGFALTAQITVHGSYGDALPALLMIGAGAGLAIAPCTDSVMGSVPPAQAGVGSATNGAALQTGGALGVGVLGSLLNARYRGDMAPTLAHLAIPPGVRNLIDSSLGGALAVANSVGGTAGAQLAHLAKDAFVSGMDLALLVGAIVPAVAAVGVLWLLPNRGPREVRTGAGQTIVHPQPRSVTTNTARSARRRHVTFGPIGFGVGNRKLNHPPTIAVGDRALDAGP